MVTAIVSYPASMNSVDCAEVCLQMATQTCALYIATAVMRDMCRLDAKLPENSVKSLASAEICLQLNTETHGL